MNVEFIEKMGTCLSVVNAARVSMNKAHTEFDMDSDMRLLRYLAKNNHWSPFGQVTMTLRVTAPVFVSRQLEKHIAGLVMGTAIPIRNEVSRRYVDEEPEFYVPAEWRERPEGNIKQGSGNVIEDDAGYLHWIYENGLNCAKNAYKLLINANVAPEMARMVLPQSMMTQWIWTGSLAAFHRIVALRIDGHAQQETQEIALRIGEICSEQFPHCWKALLESAPFTYTARSRQSASVNFSASVRASSQVLDT